MIDLIYMKLQADRWEAKTESQGRDIRTLATWQAASHMDGGASEHDQLADFLTTELNSKKPDTKSSSRRMHVRPTNITYVNLSLKNETRLEVWTAGLLLAAARRRGYGLSECLSEFKLLVQRSGNCNCQLQSKGGTPVFMTSRSAKP